MPQADKWRRAGKAPDNTREGQKAEGKLEPCRAEKLQPITTAISDFHESVQPSQETRSASKTRL